MSDKPLVSIIIIFLNAERFIDEAIESVFGQTYKNWELLLVDDGSSDNSTGITLRFAKQRIERVRYLEHAGHQNRGMSASRNLGIRHARGEYIGFLDADDVWLPHKLERQVEILNAHREAGMIYGSPQLWHGWTKKLEDIERDCLQDIGVPPDTVVSPPRLLTHLLGQEKRSRQLRQTFCCGAKLSKDSVDSRIVFGAFTRIKFFSPKSVSKFLYSYRVNVGTDIGSTGIPPVPLAGQQENTIPGIRDC